MYVWIVDIHTVGTYLNFTSTVIIILYEFQNDVCTKQQVYIILPLIMIFFKQKVVSFKMKARIRKEKKIRKIKKYGNIVARVNTTKKKKISFLLNLLKCSKF
uniref:Uncharacterized protein n=1 Tax=Cacopsylla melanoneura TaxID=428564 RepID=A0A8D8WBJ8_9HEMI